MFAARRLFVPVLLVVAAGAPSPRPGLPVPGRPGLAGEIPTVVLAPPDVGSLAEDDSELHRSPVRYGVVLPVGLGTDRSGTWERVDGASVWRVRIVSPGALSVGVTFDRFDLPAGGEVFLYDDEERHVLGAFTASNRANDGSFDVQPLPGESVVVEYVHPDSAARAPFELRIGHVVHDYRGVLQLLSSAGSCPVGIDSAEGAPFQAVERAVVRALSFGSLCAGTLLNNTAEDGTPYLLTAEHCGNLTNAVFLFDHGPCGAGRSLSGATLLATSVAQDSRLYRLQFAVPVDFEPYFAGWNRGAPGAGPTTALIPGAPGSTIAIDGDGSVAAGELWSSTWTVGVADGFGGEPLLDDEARVLGALCCGNAPVCGAQTSLFGRFDRFWTSAALSQWLDPLGTGELAIGGLDLAADPPSVTPYGCLNPPGSLSLVGVPAVGATVTFGVDNPLGTQSAGSLPWLVVALAPDPNGPPCGTSLPGLGMAGSGAPGELLVGLVPPDPIAIPGPVPWIAPGSPAPIEVPIPASCALPGTAVYVQGVLFDLSPGAAVPVGLTDALTLAIGP